MSPDSVSSAERSQIMRQVHSEDTAPEMYVRRSLHAAGFRFRLHDKRLPGRPDLVLARYRTVIFVQGCLWHWHGCRRSRMPSSNSDYWERKIARNVERDAKNTAILSDMGWRVELVWECELAIGTMSLLECLSRLAHS